MYPLGIFFNCILDEIGVEDEIKFAIWAYVEINNSECRIYFLSKPMRWDQIIQREVYRLVCIPLGQKKKKNWMIYLKKLDNRHNNGLKESGIKNPIKEK